MEWKLLISEEGSDLQQVGNFVFHFTEGHLHHGMQNQVFQTRQLVPENVVLCERTRGLFVVVTSQAL